MPTEKVGAHAAPIWGPCHSRGRGLATGLRCPWLDLSRQLAVCLALQSPFSRVRLLCAPKRRSWRERGLWGCSGDTAEVRSLQGEQFRLLNHQLISADGQRNWGALVFGSEKANEALGSSWWNRRWTKLLGRRAYTKRRRRIMASSNDPPLSRIHSIIKPSCTTRGHVLWGGCVTRSLERPESDFCRHHELVAVPEGPCRFFSISHWVSKGLSHLRREQVS